MNITVVGAGYVGLVTGVCLAEHGHRVCCVDINENKIASLKKGISPIYEPGLCDMMKKNIERLSYTTNYKEAFKECNIIFIAVGTPEKKDGSANLCYVYSALEQILENVENECVVVVKSTVPIGTTDKIEAMIKSKISNQVAITVASNPEFLAQGTAVHDTLHAARIIIGVEDEKTGNILKEAYYRFDAPLLITDRRSAEMIKYASNDFLALKISYINEVANLCEIVGANIDDVAKGMGYDSRIGNKFLKAGIGYGGSCFPKDTKALHWLASYFDYELKTIKSAIEVNENQKLKLLKKARKHYSSFNGVTVAILGLAFKPGTDDLREAPSLVNIPILLEDNAKIKVWDPVATETLKKYFPTEIIYCSTIDEAITDAEICFIFTEWDEIKQYDVKRFEKLMKRALIIDGRNCYPINTFTNVSIDYLSVGRRDVINLGV